MWCRAAWLANQTSCTTSDRFLQRGVFVVAMAAAVVFAVTNIVAVR